MASTRLYLLSVRMESRYSIDSFLSQELERSTSGVVTILHRFKVIGENNFLFVISAEDGSDVDLFVCQFIHRIPKTEVEYCSPLMNYDTFSEYLKVEKPEGDRVPVGNGPFFWLQFNIDYPGKSIEELKDIWKKEASRALQSKLRAALDLFKVVGERKVHVFIQAPVEKVDELSFTLPLVCGLGNSVRIVSKAVTRF